MVFTFLIKLKTSVINSCTILQIYPTSPAPIESITFF